MGEECALEYWRENKNFDVILITDNAEVLITGELQINFSWTALTEILLSRSLKNNHIKNRRPVTDDDRFLRLSFKRKSVLERVADLISKPVIAVIYRIEHNNVELCEIGISVRAKRVLVDRNVLDLPIYLPPGAPL